MNESTEMSLCMMQPSARGPGRPQQVFEGGREESCGFRAFLIQVLGYAACRGACARLHAVCAFTGDQKGCLRLWVTGTSIRASVRPDVANRRSGGGA